MKLKQRAFYILEVLCMVLFFQPVMADKNSIILPHKIRVKISSVNLPLKIEASGVMVDNLSLEAIKSASLIKNESIQIKRSDQWIIQKNSRFLKTNDQLLKLDSNSGRIKINLFWYPTPVYLSAKNNTRADIILNLNFDDYIKGVLIGEMPAHWPKEALKAQAIAARSYALKQAQSRKDDVFHLEGSVLDQVYSLQSHNSQLVSEVVEETKNIVLTYNGGPLKAYYHSHCGGQTEEPENIWGVGEIKIGTTRDLNCKYKKNSWSYTVSKNILAQAFGLSDLIQEPKVIRSQSGRAEYIVAHSKKITGQELRQKLGFDKLKSTLFSLTFDENSVTFTGQGYGHGSGLCQWGARDLALQGKSYKEILEHYYPLAKVSIVFESENTTTQL